MRIIKWIFILSGVILFNLFVWECLLRVYGFFEYMTTSRLEWELKNADHIFDFSPNMKDALTQLHLENKFDLEYYGKNKRITYSTVEKDNPYPPILQVFQSSYVIYNKDFKLKQITILSGECDATPSILVEKARGDKTGFGDYFVTYIFYHNDISGSNASYDRIDWYSWRGGSYDGIEELWIIPIIITEIVVLIVWLIIKRLRKRAIAAQRQS